MTDTNQTAQQNKASASQNITQNATQNKASAEQKTTQNTTQTPQKSTAICILSGGLDSATTLALALQEHTDIIAVHFSYQQRTQARERACFDALCAHYGVRGICMDAGFIAHIGGSSLTDISMDIAKSDSFTKSSSMPNTFVPFRNGVFISIAGALAQLHQARAIYIGVVWEDSSGYPDCSPEFIKAAQSFIRAGSTGLDSLAIKAPLINKTKADIARLATQLKVPLEHTWSCYEQGDIACGRCESCLLRLRGFDDAGIKDQIPYATRSQNV